MEINLISETYHHNQYGWTCQIEAECEGHTIGAIGWGEYRRQAQEAAQQEITRRADELEREMASE